MQNLWQPRCVRLECKMLENWLGTMMFGEPLSESYRSYQEICMVSVIVMRTMMFDTRSEKLKIFTHHTYIKIYAHHPKATVQVYRQIILYG